MYIVSAYVASEKEMNTSKRDVVSRAKEVRSALEENPFHLEDTRVENHVHVYI